MIGAVAHLAGGALDALARLGREGGARLTGENGGDRRLMEAEDASQLRLGGGRPGFGGSLGQWHDLHVSGGWRRGQFEDFRRAILFQKGKREGPPS